MRNRIAACAAALIALAAVPVAGAGPEVSPRPGVVVSTPLSVQEIATVYCWGRPWWVQWHRRSTVGLSVWKYRLTIDRFCWNGTKIVSIHSFRSVKINAPLWDFCCHISQRRTWNAAWSFKRWTEGKFVFTGLPGLAVRTPEIWFKVRGDGWYDWGAVGD